MDAKHRVLGFTLIEVMIVVVIVAILASIAFPAYDRYVTRAERADGQNALTDVLLRQERFRANNPQYTNNFGSENGLRLDSESQVTSYDSDEERWRLTITSSDSNAFTVQADKVSGRTDSTCDPMVVTVTRDTGETTRTPEECW
ncbi:MULTISPECIES: type IV pilin protein [unclassified Thioalkalivibrio]|uniref:type IV pilin protein n=1 Tax=unclassified Thioalkalivibrio TaxID=2621013 RepID=UPI00036868EA|nr:MULTISPECIES: type IV pilin protein [unclassified Thioalkalivibrio]